MTREEAIEIWQSGGGFCPRMVSAINTVINAEFKALSQQTEDAISRAEVHNLMATWISDHLTDETREALETIDYKIEDLPSATPKAEPCEDAISREQALKLFATHDGHYLYEAIRDLPPVTPMQRTGHWIKTSDTDENGNAQYTCSECYCGDVHAEVQIVPYCWKCGAKMVEPQESEG